MREDSEGPSAAQSLPYGSVCAGCHTSNYDPRKVTPVPTATSTKGAVSWAASPSTAAAIEQTTGNAPFSEPYIGCSSCHYGANATGGLAIYGADPNDTAHRRPVRRDGQCGHLRRLPFAVLLHGRHDRCGAGPVSHGDHAAAGYARHAEPECDDPDPAADGDRLPDARGACVTAGYRLESGRIAQHDPQHPDVRLDTYSDGDRRWSRQAADLLAAPRHDRRERCRRTVGHQLPLAADWPRRQRLSVS